MQTTNQLIAQSIAQTTIPFRFAGHLNTNQRKIANNLVLFPRMHFMPFLTANSATPLLSSFRS